jgi:hypothetical protein
MAGSTWRALALVAAGALVVAGVAGAANTGSFVDPAGDSGTAPDVTGVAIANDDAGNVTIKVTLSNRSAFTQSDGVGVGIDADQNPDTGMVFYGAEFEVDLEGSTVRFYRSDPNGLYQETTAPPSVRASFSGGVATFTFNPTELGVTSGFNVYALGYGSTFDLDPAPDIRAVNYQMVSGAKPPVLAPDRRPPLDIAFKASGTHGKVVALGYVAADGRGETSDAITVYKGKKVLKRISFPLADTSPFYPYVAHWKVPKKTKGKLRFCVVSTDRAGNKSKQTCAALTIK